jgi:hypothetical protein
MLEIERVAGTYISLNIAQRRVDRSPRGDETLTSEGVAAWK